MKNILSFSLILGLVTFFTISTFAAETKTSEKEKNPWDNPELGAEDVKLRDRFSKHFFVSPTQKKAMTFSGPIHYRSGNAWLEISNDLKVNTTGSYPNHPYYNDQNEFTSFYPSDPSVDGFVMEYHDAVVVEKLKGLKFLDINGNIIGMSGFSFGSYQLEGANVIRYTEVVPGMDLVYSQNSTGKKMVIEVKNASALSLIPNNTDKLVIIEEIELPTGVVVNDFDGNLEIKQGENHLVTYIRPLANEGELTTSLEDEIDGEISYALNGNVLEFESGFDANWIRSTDREFPIHLDPTANYARRKRRLVK